MLTTEYREKRAKKFLGYYLKKLAASVSSKDINSIYEWEGKKETVNEVEIIIKSKLELKNTLVVFL